MNFRKFALATVFTVASVTAAHAAEPDSCKKVHIADVGWSDNTAINGRFTTTLKGLGYAPKVDTLALPVILESLKNKDLDIFLDNWMPSNEANVRPYVDAKTIDMLKANLVGANYAPVVPDYVAAEGVKTVHDLATNGDKFSKKFYGIEPGNDGNKIVQTKIDDPSTGLKGWKVVESSEQGMLAEAQKKMAKKEWVVFLGWTPHPVMGLMPLVYLTGWEKEGFGGAEIHTLTRPGYSAECTNVGKLLDNLQFDLKMESTVMKSIADGQDGEKAATAWLKENPAVLDKWLAGVTTADGQDGAAAVKKSLGL